MEDCIFCKIATGVFGSATIYENEDFKVILDKFPSNIGHILIIPKTHADNIFQIDEDLGGRLFKLAIKTAKAMKDSLGVADMNILQNNGEIAGQTVNHFHLHLIPRHSGDDVTIKWNTQKPSDEDIENIRKSIAEQIARSVD